MTGRPDGLMEWKAIAPTMSCAVSRQSRSSDIREGSLFRSGESPQNAWIAMHSNEILKDSAGDAETGNRLEQPAWRLRRDRTRSAKVRVCRSKLVNIRMEVPVWVAKHEPTDEGLEHLTKLRTRVVGHQILEGPKMLRNTKRALCRSSIRFPAARNGCLGGPHGR